MPPEDRHPHAQRTSERAALGGDVASQALNEALRVSFLILKLAMLLVALLFAGSGVFIVKEGEQAFVLRFGRIVTRYDPQTDRETAILKAGIHFAWPFLVDEVVRFPVERVLRQREDAFWYQEVMGPSGPRIPPGIAPDQGGYHLTGDANILHSRWEIQYRVFDPVKFARTLDDPAALASEEPTGRLRGLMSALLRNAVARAISRFPVDAAYRTHQEDLRSAARDGLVADLDALDMGIQVSELLLRPIVPPRQVRAAFDDAEQAAQESSKLIHDAEAYANKVINEAKSNASRLLAKAKAYKNQIAKQAAADADYIQKLREQPGALSRFLEQRRLEVIEKFLEAADEIFIVKEGRDDIRQKIITLLNRDPKTVRERRAEEEKQEGR
jgi:regulator of protease activity HflC (stomatin/prohibitin superfamily)